MFLFGVHTVSDILSNSHYWISNKLNYKNLRYYIQEFKFKVLLRLRQLRMLPTASRRRSWTALWPVIPTSVPTPLPVRSDLTLIIDQRSLLTSADFKLASSLNYCSETSFTPTSVPTPLPVRSDLTLFIYQRSLLTLADSILASSKNYCPETSRYLHSCSLLTWLKPDKVFNIENRPWHRALT
jgi:hypothetical protein